MGSMLSKPLSLCLIFLTLLLEAGEAHCAAQRSFIAFSTREARHAYEAAMTNKRAFSTTRPDAYYLGGITWPWAVVVDSEDIDVILVGENLEEHSLLTLDDWAVALRARYFHPESDPGVTLLPNVEACDPANFIECFVENGSSVHFFGGIQNTGFGSTCLKADIVLKAITLNRPTLPIDPALQQLPTILQELLRDKYESFLHRFWIQPLINEVTVGDRVAIIQRFEFGVLGEVEWVRDLDGGIIRDSTIGASAVNEFARQLTRSYDTLAEHWSELDRVKGLTRLSGLADGLKALSQPGAQEFLLFDYAVSNVPTAKNVSTQVNSTLQNTLVTGGVELQSLLARLQQGEVAAFRDLVLAARPRTDSLVWNFETVEDRKKIVNISYSSSVDELAGMAPIVRQAELLISKEHYEVATDLLDTVLGVFPGHEDARTLRALAFIRTNQAKKALKDLDYLLRGGKNEHAHILRAVVFLLNGSHKKAIKELEKAIAINPNAAVSFFLRAVARSQISRAIDSEMLTVINRDLDRVLELAPETSVALLFRGIFYLEATARGASGVYVDDAINAFSVVIDRNQFLPMAYRARGLAFLAAKRYDEAVLDLTAVINDFPADSIALYARADALENLRQYVAAEVDRYRAARGREVVLKLDDEIVSAVSKLGMIENRH